MSHLTPTEVGQNLDRIVTLDTSEPPVGDGDALVALKRAPQDSNLKAAPR